MAKRGSLSGPDGVLLIDKEPDWTSHDVVAKLRGLLRQRRIGHTGTLDPAATGLLIACVGRATRLVEYMTASDKRYTGEIVLGVTTDTDDAKGETIAQVPPPDTATLDLGALAQIFTGTQLQRPPAYSAVKVAGQPAYRAARRGDALTLAERPVTIHELELWPTGRDRLGLRLHCGSGTYVRSIARDLGERLGCGAHLASLRRISVGPFSVDDAHLIGDVVTAAARGAAPALLLPTDAGISAMDAALVSDEHARALAHGQQPQVRRERPGSTANARVYTPSGEFVAVASVSETGLMVARKVLRESAS